MPLFLLNFVVLCTLMRLRYIYFSFCRLYVWFISFGVRCTDSVRLVVVEFPLLLLLFLLNWSFHSIRFAVSSKLCVCFKFLTACHHFVIRKSCISSLSHFASYFRTVVITSYRILCVCSAFFFPSAGMFFCPLSFSLYLSLFRFLSSAPSLCLSNSFVFCVSVLWIVFRRTPSIILTLQAVSQ